MSELQSIAAKYLDYFEVAYRDPEDTKSSYVCIKKGVEEELHDHIHNFVYTVHKNCLDCGMEFLPDDYKYLWIYNTLESLKDGGSRDDLTPDDYNYERLNWLSSHGNRSAYVDQYKDIYGESENVMDAIGNGQLLEMWEVWDRVVEFLESELDEDEDENDDSEEE